MMGMTAIWKKGWIKGCLFNFVTNNFLTTTISHLKNIVTLYNAQHICFAYAPLQNVQWKSDNIW